jgi:RNA polymerase sigma-70 factor, ECF subfamily
MTMELVGEAGVSEPMPDEEVVRRVRGGAPDLYELLMRRHNRRVYRAVRAILKDEAEVEDVMQEAYVLAYLHLDQFAGMARFSTWLVRIAINEALRRRRPSRLVLVADQDDLDGDGSAREAAGGRTPEEEAEGREIVSLVERALDGLPEMYRSVLVLRELEELTTSEVAGILGISEDAVKTRVHRARALLHDGVQARAEDLAGVFPFGGRRCDRVVAAVLDALATLP